MRPGVSLSLSLSRYPTRTDEASLPWFFTESEREREKAKTTRRFVLLEIIGDVVGGWRGKLSQTQVLTLDVGAADALRPTALLLRCGAKQRSLDAVGSLDCPKFFELSGAPDGADPHDERAYSQLFAHRVLNVAKGAAQLYAGGALFEFATATRFAGRAVRRCSVQRQYHRLRSLYVRCFKIGWRGHAVFRGEVRDAGECSRGSLQRRLRE